MKDSTKVLLWANLQRLKRRRAPLFRLPKGTRANWRYCPVALALDARVGNTSWWSLDEFVNNNPGGPLPEFVQRFVTDFDAGLYPQYNLPPPR